MDVGFYLGELLMQKGEVSVPGLGSFLQVRMSAYYNESDALFYPPFNKVHFEPKTDVESSELAEYLAGKKGISIASAKYFIEKYIGNLRQQATVADVALGNMGVFFADGVALTFKPNDKLSNDADFYAYAPVKISKANAIAAYTEPETLSDVVLYPRPKSEPAEVEEDFIEPVAEKNIEHTAASTYDEGFLDLPEEEEESRGPLRAILISFVVVAVLALGVFALYRYQPATFDKLQFWKNNKPAAPVKITPKLVIAPKPDSLNTDSAKKPLNDSARAATADTLAKQRFELITGKGFKNLWGANEAVKKYKAMGLQNAKLAELVPGRLIKVSLGSFNTLAESESLKLQLIKGGKLSKGAYSMPIPNKTTTKNTTN